jgi:hypothetical protein
MVDLNELKEKKAQKALERQASFVQGIKKGLRL